MPGITKHLMCIGTRRSTWVNVQRFYEYCKASRIFISCRVTDKGRPVLLGNMTFTWTAPSSDYGPIRCLLMINSSSNKCRQTWKNILFSFVLSVVKGNRFTEVSSAQIPFNAFPVSIRGFQTQCSRLNLFIFYLLFLKRCGRQLSCFRRCTSQPTCPAEESDFMVVIDLTRLSTPFTAIQSDILTSQGWAGGGDQHGRARGGSEGSSRYQDLAWVHGVTKNWMLSQTVGRGSNQLCSDRCRHKWSSWQRGRNGHGGGRQPRSNLSKLISDFHLPLSSDLWQNEWEFADEERGIKG